jgi:hypothetical protein
MKTRAWLVLLTLAGLGACQNLNVAHETARQSLILFCHFHLHQDIVHVLTTPEELAAGRVVCRAVGLSLGEP